MYFFIYILIYEINGLCRSGRSGEQVRQQMWLTHCCPNRGIQKASPQLLEIGLLCVQENPADRPDASAVVLMLSSPTSTSDDRRTPSRPALAFSSGFTAAASGGPTAGSWSSDSVLIGDQQRSTAAVSENEMSISELQPR